MRIIEKIKGTTLFRDMSWIFISGFICNLLRFLMIFIIIKCYSQEEFGLWASITSIAAIIVTGDFGLTNVLRNIATEGLSEGEEGDKRTRNYYFSTVFFFLLIACLGAIVLVVFRDYIPYGHLFKTDNIVIKQQSVIICNAILLIFLFNMPLGITAGMFYSFGESKRIAIIGLVNSIITFVVISVMGIYNISIVWSAIAYFAISLIINLIVTIRFIQRRNWYRVNDLTFGQVCNNLKYMLPLGMKFLGIGFASSFISNILTIYSGSMLGLREAANVNVAQKIFTFFCTLLQSVFNPIWAKLSTLYYTEQIRKCKVLLYRSLGATFLLSVLAILVATFLSPFLVDIIATTEYETSYLLFALVGICSCMKISFDNASLLLTAISKLNIVCVGYLVFTFVVAFAFPKIVSAFGFDIMMGTLIACWILFILVALLYTNQFVFNTKQNEIIK